MEYDFFACSNQKCRMTFDVRDNAPDVSEEARKRLAQAALSAASAPGGSSG
jgi:hypothetical protein